MRKHSLQQVHILTDASAVYIKYIYLLMRQHSLQQVHILTDASTQSTTIKYTYWWVNTVYEKSYIHWCVNTVYNKYIYFLMCQHSLQQVHILTDASAVYNKYIYLLMRQQSTTSTYTHWCVNSLQQVHIEQHEPLKHGVNACDPKEKAFPAPLTVPVVYSLLQTR